MTGLLRRDLPPPPPWLRRGPLRQGAFGSTLRTRGLTLRLGTALGIAFVLAFATGVLSHLIQQPPGWFDWPTRPIHLYRVTQGLHVASGLACVPLLLAKLWSVYPRLFVWPPVRHLLHAVERLSVLMLVGSTVFLVVSGVLNVSRIYGYFGFFFPVGHYWTAWIAAGALLIHVAAKVVAAQPTPADMTAHGRAEPLVVPPPPEVAPHAPAAPTGLISRRGLLTGVGASVAVVTVATAGQTVPGLAPLSLLAPRVPDIGDQGLPVNKSARSARITPDLVAAGYRLRVEGPSLLELTLEDLRAMPQTTARLAISCVEGWSATARWTGVSMIDLLAAAGLARPGPGTEVLVESLQRTGRYRSSVLSEAYLRDPLTLLALRIGDEALSLDHGFPCRLIAANRPGVMQTKWVHRLVVRGAA